MGMAASQGRLLFMTARISNNEFEQQCVAYSKQRLADDSQKANDQYLEALQATQYQILTGYNGDTPNYEPVTYKQLTELNKVATGKQYIVSDNKGQIVVTDEIAKAFDEKYLVKGNGHTNVDFNTFLKNVTDVKLTQVEKSEVTEADVHEAWDKYFASINKGHKDGIYNNNVTDHILGFTFHDAENAQTTSYATYNSAYYTYEEKDDKGNILSKKNIYLNESGDGSCRYYYVNYEVEADSRFNEETQKTEYYAKYKPSKDNDLMMDADDYVILEDVPVTWDEDNQKFKFKGKDALYVDQATGAITENRTTTNVVPTGNEESVIFYEGTSQEQRDLYDYAMAVSEKYAKGSELTYDADKVQYYKNIYQQMITKGFTTFEKMTSEGYINTMSYKGADGETSLLNSEKLAFNNDNWLVTLLKNGKLSIAFYDINDKNFVKTTLDDDESIVEKENKSKMAIAEQVYQTHMDRIESEDKRFDMQLTKLESEHQALTTEYDSVAKVISKNVEKSFNVFNA